MRYCCSMTLKAVPNPKKTPPTAAQDQRTPLREPYPDISPYSSGFLSVDDVHTLYWEQSGNPDGVPVIFLHGGPGGGASPKHRTFFDPSHYRIIIFDQRGAGRSTPLGCLEKNTLTHLISDIDALRKHLNIGRWHIFGGSWGSTLGLAYAQTFPQHCISMTLYGIFLCEQSEIDWFLYGMGSIFPEKWEEFSEFIPEAERYDLLDAYHMRLTGDDEKMRYDAALRWVGYEKDCSALIPRHKDIVTPEQKNYALAMARIEAHYFRDHVIPVYESLMHKIDIIRAIPSTIVHGRYDVICPIQTAYRLHLAWPEADYIVVPDGGHSAFDPAVQSRLIEAADQARNLRLK
jgi:proline iminopeptidase